MPIEPGQELLHYRLIEQIGEGGMGVVWKAVDTTLDREVAIKILPLDVGCDAQRLARFEREAKLLASLNHPHVATVYGVHCTEETQFLAMELVPGEDLAQRLKRGRLPVDQAVCIAGRIADALEAAHEQGVIHRDLKPANVVVTPDNGVKILDFGLAKATGAPAGPDQDLSALPTRTTTATVDGVLLGTPAYMSPEQARGQKADARSDIWAFGCVLWECLTGKRLFAEATMSDTLAAILNREPEWNGLPSGTPPNVGRLLRRCLTKDARGRYHHVADVRIELEDSDETGPPAGSPVGFRIATFVLAPALIVAGALLVSAWNRPVTFEEPGSRANPLADARFSHVTDDDGGEFDAAISRGGRFVAFQADSRGHYGVYVTQIGTNWRRELTTAEDRLVKPVRGVRRVGFNATDTEIWIHGGVGQRMKAAPLLDGPARNFLGEDTTNVEWSPDGANIVYYDRTAGDPIFIADGDGANPRKILEAPAGVHQHFPIWSVDGKWIYFTRGLDWGTEMQLWRVRPDGSDPERLTHNLRRPTYPTPLDETAVLVVARDAEGAGPWLWAVDVEKKEARRATIGLERYSSISASADRRRLVATVEDPSPKLWSVPILDRPATERDAVIFEPTEGVRALAPRFSGTSLFFLSSLGGGLNRLDDGEVREISLGARSGLLTPPAFSSDGAWMVLVQRRDGKESLHIASVDGAQRRRLTDKIKPRKTAAWSPDGRWVAIGGTVDGVVGLFKVPVAGGDPELIVEGAAFNPEWSPDGAMIVYVGEQVGAHQALRAVDPEGNPIELPEVQLLVGGERYRFTADGSALIFMQGVQAGQNFERLDLRTLERRVLTRLDSTAEMRTFDITPDGKNIVFDRLEDVSDIVLIELKGDDVD